MTESFRRSGEYPQGDDHQATDPMRAAYPQQQPVSSSPVNPEWPPPPAYAPVAPVAVDPG
ncbi:serine protease, partial [Streptomyces mirabilis]